MQNSAIIFTSCPIYLFFNTSNPGLCSIERRQRSCPVHPNLAAACSAWHPSVAGLDMRAYGGPWVSSCACGCSCLQGREVIPGGVGTLLFSSVSGIVLKK